MDTTIPGVLAAAASTRGHHPAYVAGGTVVTFADLLAWVRETARGYCALGLQPGDRVCVWAPNSIEWVVSALAATYAGGVLVPVNSRYTASEAADIVERTRATLVVVDDGFLGRTQIADLRAASTLATVREVIDVNDLERLAALPSDVDIDSRARAVTPDDVADILFTSGTTGRSKGATSTHRQTVGVADIWGRLGGVSAADRYLVVNPFFHAFGYKVGIVTGLLTGATLYPMATFDVAEVARVVETARITVLPGAPTIFSSLLAADAHRTRDLSSLRLAVTGAAVVPVVLIERMRSELEIDQVVTAFGMTEAVVATMCRGDEPADVVAS
ncbi:MAG TPA: AMP-binding protein, partial [Nocardioides sp.]